MREVFFFLLFEFNFTVKPVKREDASYSVFELFFRVASSQAKEKEMCYEELCFLKWKRSG